MDGVSVQREQENAVTALPVNDKGYPASWHWSESITFFRPL
jgi:hypothetical protein